MSFMTGYIKQLATVMLTVMVITLTGCGGSDDGGNIVSESPLWCKSPETINEAGSACELVIVPCNYPEVANDLGLCEMSIGEWRPGANGINMPEPEYIPASGEVVLYYALQNGDYDGWGLHAFNEGLCTSWAMFDAPGGDTTGTSWGIPIDPTGVDPNFGVYWVLDTTENPNCGNWIPYDFDDGIQVQFTAIAELADETVNPTGRHFLLEGTDIVFPYPRTFDSLVVPGGSTLSCEAPLILNEAGDECITDPSIVQTFVPGESVLYLRGDFNGWLGEATDEELAAYNFTFDVVTNNYVMATPLAAGTYGFKVADIDWSDATSFGTLAGEEEVIIDDGKTLTVTDGQNISINVAADGNYQFSFNASDAENPVLTVTEVALGKVMYVKGSLNDWSATSPMVYEGNNIYTSVYALTEADYEFKIADDDWTEATNFGAAAGDEALELEIEKSLVFGEGIAQNITLTIAAAGSYKFVLDATNPEAPLLTVINAVPYGSNELYMKGTMNEWTQTEGFGFSYADNHYTLVTLLQPATHEFKIAPDDWNDAATIGGLPDNSVITVGEALDVAVKNDGGSENLRLVTDEAKMYSLDVDATDKTAPILLVNEYIPFAGRAMHLKGTMNGWSVVDGYEFTYVAGIYTLEVSLEAQTHEFKIASADWEDDSTVGALPENSVITVDEPLTVGTKNDGGADNLRLVVDATTTYIMTVDATTVGAPVLTVTVKE